MPPPLSRCRVCLRSRFSHHLFGCAAVQLAISRLQCLSLSGCKPLYRTCMVAIAAAMASSLRPSGKEESVTGALSIKACIQV